MFASRPLRTGRGRLWSSRRGPASGVVGRRRYDALRCLVRVVEPALRIVFDEAAISLAGRWEMVGLHLSSGGHHHDPGDLPNPSTGSGLIRRNDLKRSGVGRERFAVASIDEENRSVAEARVEKQDEGGDDHDTSHSSLPASRRTAPSARLIRP